MGDSDGKVPQHVTDTIRLVIEAQEIVGEIRPFISSVQSRQQRLKEIDGGVQLSQQSIDRVDKLLEEKRILSAIALQLQKCFEAFEGFDEAIKNKQLHKAVEAFKLASNLVRDSVESDQTRSPLYLTTQMKEELLGRKKRLCKTVEASLRDLVQIKPGACIVHETLSDMASAIVIGIQLCELNKPLLESFAKEFSKDILCFLLDGTSTVNVQMAVKHTLECVESESITESDRVSFVLRQVKKAFSFIPTLMRFQTDQVSLFGSLCWGYMQEALRQCVCPDNTSPTFRFEDYRAIIENLVEMETELLKEGLITQQSSRWAEKVDGDFSGFVNMKMRAVLGEVRAIVLNYDFELQPQEPLIFSDHKQRSPYTKQFLESLPYLSFNPFHRDGSNSDVFSTSPFEFPKYLVSKSANSIVKAIQSVIQDAQQQTSPRCDEIYKLGRTTLSLLKVLLQSKTSKSLTDGPKQSMILALDSLYVSHFITVTSLLQHSRYGDYNDISVSLGEIGRRTIRSAIDKVGSQALNQLSAARAYEQSPRGSKFDSFRNNTTGSSKCITIISSACIGWMVCL
eukprot:TRINITY_DN5220_c0_g1_i3.p1 TRINITY_DN5220_c0_g1~~TRINITY_DN5220_c0_g1_i3.p1  ORF type:complete len:567 (-),score=88.35 TRINITY_DN5220_c0_g1_i3:211-1911(-)